MRPMTSSGAPYPRSRPINWAWVADIRRKRTEARTNAAEGFELVRAFANLRWESPGVSHRIVDVRIGAGGESLWVKLEKRA